MSVKDRDKHYRGLAQPDSVAQTPNTVSRNLKVGDRAFQTTVWESAKPVLDADLQVAQDSSFWEDYILRRWEVHSGWLRGQTHRDAYDDYILEVAPSEVVDDSEAVESIGESVGPGSIGDGTHILDDRTLIDAILLPRIEAIVGGRPVVVEFTNTRTPGYNLVALEPPTIYDGTIGTVKRTDFVFLEVWLALVAPSPKALGSVTVADASSMVAGDLITINGINLTATLGVPLVDEFLLVPADNNATATNIATALNAPANSFSTIVEAAAYANVVEVQSTEPGFGEIGPQTGNYITLAVTTTVIGALAVSGPNLTGGEDRPNKPVNAQDKLFRHGNVLSAPVAYLDDVMIDPIVNRESSQRVQLQYRIRSTGSVEGVNFKTHPDGFSTKLIGPNAGIFAQGARSTPASNVSGRAYPFVPADRVSIWDESSAVEYGVEDNGLWVSGDGSVQSSKDLGTVDGFVYAIPLCFVFRYNDASNPAAASKGFNPVSNTNGAPRYQHVAYNGALGVIGAGLSDRPDGEFADVIAQSRLLDLRRHVMPAGADLQAELTYQVQSLLDGSLRTWQVDTASKQELGGGSGDVSTRYLICNEVGREAAQHGSPPSSGDTQRGETIRNFDHVARRFGDQPVIERLVVAYNPADRDSGASIGSGVINPGKYVEKVAGSDQDEWWEGDILHLDLANLDVTSLGGVFQGLTGRGCSGTGLPNTDFVTFAPPGTKITDVLSIYHDDGNWDTPIEQQVEMRLVGGLGTDHLQVMLDDNERLANGGISGAPGYRLVGSGASIGDAGSPRRIFLEVEITYPLGVGTTDTPDHEIEPDAAIYDGSQAGPGPLIENNTTQRPNDFEDLLEPKFRQGYREVMLEYVANDTNGLAPGDRHSGSPVGLIHHEDIVSREINELYFPRRVWGGDSMMPTVDGVVTPGLQVVDHTQTEFGSSSRKVVLSALTPLQSRQELCNIEYYPQDAIPNYGPAGGGYQIGVYFRSNVPQTAGVMEGNISTSTSGVLPTILRVEPLAMGQNIWTGQVGMGSLDLAFPYGSPLDQIAVNDGVMNTIKEWYFCASAQVTIDNFDADTGLLALHPFVQGDVQNILEFGGAGLGEPPTKDAEFRAYYPFADDESYRPTIMSQPLYGATRHKVFVPMLCRATEEIEGPDGGLLYRKDELLLIVVSRFAELDDDNTVRFVDPAADNRTCAALYRTRNLLLVVGPKGV